ncbi:hypothetical protein AY600_05255 [Phormidium willei BDU 130791]|nr:hypothetical protein AY600_05255 [Phormidium willei BDU 130791]
MNPPASGHPIQPIFEWSKNKLREIDQLHNELSNKNKAIENLQTELDSARAQIDNKNLDQTTQVAQLDDSGIEKTALEVNTENEDLWEQLKPHVNQEIREQQKALAKHFMDHLNNMRDKIQKDIEARFKEQNQIELPDQTQSDHDSSWSETSSDTLSSPRQDTIGANTEIQSSRVTSSSIDSQPHDWSWLHDSKPDDRTVVSPDNIEEMRAKDAPILLTQQTRGNYWIVKHPHSSIFYLVPDPKISFNEHNIEYAKKIFNCQNYDDLKRQTFQVQQPAIVKQLETEKKWEIQEKGKLIFVSRN